MQTPWPSQKGRPASGIGPKGARVLIVGEVLGREEEAEGEPLIGPPGQFLFKGRDWQGQTKWQGLESLGLPRNEMRIESVVEIRPPSDHLHELTPANVAKWQEGFWKRLEGLEPTVIVPVGNLALNTLRRTPLPLTKRGTWKIKSTPQGKQINWTDKVSNWRGSIFNVRANNGRKVKVIPTYHPNFVLRASDSYDAWQGDWERILGDQHFPELRRDPKAEHFIEPTPRDAHAFEMLVHQHYSKDPKHAVLAIDIETMAGGHIIDCIGFSVEETFSMTFVLKERWAWEVVTRLLKHPIAKGWHYGLYDCYVLGQKGKDINNTRWDSQQMHHCLDPRDEHRLAYCASRDLRVRYWKHENKEEGKAVAQIKDPRKRWRYNGKDVCYTRALIERYRGRLRESSLLHVYRDHYRRLTAACLRLTQTGQNVDEAERARIHSRERDIVKHLRQQMKELAGTDLVANKGLSPLKVNAYFYDSLKCKPFFRRGSGRRTADELSIRKLMRKYKKARAMGSLVLGYREHGKIAQEVRPSIVSKDGRLRSRYSPTTDTGRLRAMMVSDTEGINAQNRDRKSDLRRMFIADPGHVLLEFDQAQAEDRIASGMSGHPASLKLARTAPGDVDRHLLAAAAIFPESYEELFAAYKTGDGEADEKRQTGKRTKYACWYGMGGYHMAEVTLVETEGKVVYDPDECEEWIATLKKNDPGIELYQSWIRQQQIELGELRSSWGRTVYFKGLRLSKEDHKQGYAWLPQHEVGVLTNVMGFVPADDRIEGGEWRGAKIVQQGHDSLQFTSPPKWAYDIAKFVTESMGAERTYPGAGGPWAMSMPIGVKVGHNWKDMKEWKQIPPREEFERCLKKHLK